MQRFVRTAAAFAYALSCLGTATCWSATPQDLESAFLRSQWDETAQIAFELLSRDPNNTTAKIRGAYALFQRGYVNAALSFLRRLSPDEWRKLPQGSDRFVEVVTLFQKKVPLDVLPGRLENTSIEKVSPFLRDEVRFAQGRAALSKGDLAEAKRLLSAVSRGSRYFASARYLLGSIAVREGKTDLAAQEFSRMFEPQVLDQMSEFWNDLSSNVTSHWGASVKVMLDAQGLLKERTVAELGVLAIARLAYQKGNYKAAIAQYERIPADSPYYSRANFEKMWALLALENHEAAAAAAAMVSRSDGDFVSYEARPARALILVDYGKTDESRRELDKFEDEYRHAKKALERFVQYKTADEMPSFIAHDLSLDPRVANHRSYQALLKHEIAELRKQDRRIYPLYDALASELEPLIQQSQAEVQRISVQYAERRLKDLERLRLQAKLIRAETWLEDREILRKEFRARGEPTEQSARKHDERLVDLMERAVKEVEEALAMSKRRAFNLEFRQAELYWELATARGILSIATGKEEDKRAAAVYKNRALEIAKRIGDTATKFAKHAQAIFFAGFMQLEEGDLEGGERTLERYLATYPRHDHTADALRILADLRFDRNDFRGAMDYYRRVLEFPDTPIVGYALYKIGWCSYNLYEYPRALRALEQAILWARTKGDEKQSLNLSREARRDLIAMYAEVGDPDKALSYFKSVFAEEGEAAYVDFGRELDSTGQYEKSAPVWRNIIAMNPTSPNNVQYQTFLLRGSFKLRSWPDVEKQLHELVDRYRKQLQKPTEEGTPPFEAEKMAREVVLSQHFEFKDSREDADVERILRMDRDYLATFGNWPGYREVLYEYALELMKNKRYADAVPAFKEHWSKFGGELKEPVREEALRNLLVSLEKVEAKEPESTKMTPIAQDIDRFSKEYLKSYPDSKHARTIAGVRAAVLFKHGDLDTGIKESEAILARKANDPVGQVAFQNLRVAYYQRKDWKATYEWATALAAREDMKERRKDLDRIRGEAAFLYAEGLVNDDEAAREYLRIAEDPGMAFLRDKALYNAFLRKEKSGKRIEALELANRLEKEAPNFEGLKQASGLRAAMYQEAGDYKRALPMLRRLTKEPDKELKPEILRQARLNAALILEALEDKDAAAKEYKALIAAQDGDAVATEAKRGLERLFPKADRDVASEPAGFEAAMRMAREFEKAPMPSGKKVKDLAERIKAGAIGLDNVTKALLAIATGKDVPPKYAFEAYCALPFAYDAYADGIRNLGKGGPEELRTELEKIASPLSAKGDEVAKDCLQRAEEAQHEGPNFRRALSRSGWRRDTELVKRVVSLSKALAAGSPWLDPPKVAPDEKEILERHLAGKADDESWYALAVARLRDDEPGLARLTLVDALGRKPGNVGRLYNAIVIAAPPPTVAGRIAAFEKAIAEGSVAANANLALIHLRGDRLRLAMTYVQAAASKGLFKDTPVEAAVKEVMAP